MDFRGPQGVKNGADPKNLRTSILADILMGLSAINLDTRPFTHIINRECKMAGLNLKKLAIRNMPGLHNKRQNVLKFMGFKISSQS